MFRKTISKTISGLLAMVIVFAMLISVSSRTVLAEPTATIKSTNPWGNGGQITLTLNGSGCSSVTVVVNFGGAVSSASGWGFDTYTINGSLVSATVSSTGSNSWGLNGDVGIQVEGSNINSITLVSVSGDGATGSVISPGAPVTPATPTTPVAPSVTTTPVNTNVPVTNDDWLTTNGNKIVDMNGNEVWLTGVNWFGYNTGTNIFDGCWSCSMSGALKDIADHGFNLLRVPMSAELILNWKNGVYPAANYNTSTNPDLIGKNSLQIFDYALDCCKANGIKVMIDIHCADTDPMGHNKPLWYSDKISTAQYLEALDWISARYKNNDTVVAYDLKNEPHGAANEAEHAIWNGSTDANNWRYIAAVAGNTVLNNNPNALIVIEGNQIYPKNIATNNFTSKNAGDYYNAWWGGNLMGVKDYPVDMGSAARNKQIVYSPHDYGPAVSTQPWFHAGFTKQSLMNEYWYNYWFYIVDQNIAPVLIGEWGGFMSGDNLIWMTYLRELIGEYHLNYTFWCFNANSGDTGGLVLDDFKTWDNTKYDFVKAVIWTDTNGKFVGLDHEIPLGSNGISLNEYYGKRVESQPSEQNGVSDFIERLYTIALSRNSEPAGKEYWINEVKLNGKNGADLVNGFLYSTEFLNKNMSNDEFLTILYRTFFDREPDPNGFAYWKNYMANGMSKEGVIKGFVDSYEWANLCLRYGILSGSSVEPTIKLSPNEKTISFVMRLYNSCLGRDYDPSGLTYWSDILANLKMGGSKVAEGFFFSDEFIGFNVTDEEYITRLYRTFMGREPEEAGFNYWLNNMRSGQMNRRDVLYGFSVSNEWGNLCMEYGILR